MTDWTAITGFQWDEANATGNHDKHGVGCPECESVFPRPMNSRERKSYGY